MCVAVQREALQFAMSDPNDVAQIDDEATSRGAVWRVPLMAHHRERDRVRYVRFRQTDCVGGLSWECAVAGNRDAR